MARGEVLGHIDCPCCGLKEGMRVTEDKSGNPFGFCDFGGNQQLRVGGSSERVAQFFQRYPHVRRPGTVTGTGNANPVTDTVPVPKKSSKASALEIFGVAG